MQNSIKRFNHDAKMKAGQTFGTEEFQENKKNTRGSSRAFVQFEPNAQRLTNDLKVVRGEGLRNGARANPGRSQEKAIFEAKKGLLRETHGERQDKIEGQESRMD